EFNCGAIISMGSTTDLSDDVVAAYNAPFPDDTYCAAARRMPVLVPISGDDPASPGNRAAWEVLESWTKPVLVAFSDSDPITGGGEKPFLTRIPAAGGPEQVVIEGGGHFLQEDRGPELAAAVNRFVAANP
ncbi:MAG TPA: haloalkane dehalogenase, partial [Microthrixaceae bacterium]|nr:haloalkane dehalogenase [Microthrixaceae bacterium]